MRHTFTVQPTLSLFMPVLMRLAMRLLAALMLATAANVCVAGPPTAPIHHLKHAISDYGQRDDVNAFIAEAVQTHGFNRRALHKLFRQVKAQRAVLRLMSKPVDEPPKWYEYAPHLLTDDRIAAGVSFWRENADALAAAEREFGVPPEIVVAIIGVETFYGRMRGGYRVIDALTTLAFDYPRRAEFFRRELTEFLLLCREQGVSPLDPRGSFAGAMGLPQFMPGTFRVYAVDFDRDGRLDIWRDTTDAIGSVANFLEWHGWQRGGPVLVPAQIDHEEALAQLVNGYTPRRALDEWNVEGVRPREAVENSDPQSTAALVLLEEPAVATYWLGFNNFYVLTRYNRSRLYAAAVWQLAQMLRAAHVAAAAAKQ